MSDIWLPKPRRLAIPRPKYRGMCGSMENMDGGFSGRQKDAGGGTTLLTNLVAYWKLDEASGSRADSKGSNTLGATGTVTGSAGKISNAALFPGTTGSYLSLADNTDLSTGDIDFTFNCWVNSAHLGPGFSSGFPFIASKGWQSDSNANQEWALIVNGVGGPFEFAVGFGTSTKTIDATNFGAAPATTWCMVTCWHNSVANEIGIAVNAGTANTTAHSGGVNDGTREFTIGDRANHNLPWNGLIDECGFWKRVLTGAERTSLYNSGSGLAFSSF